MRRLNVRCCCQPVKILGTLPWDEKSCAMTFKTIDGSELTLRIETMGTFVKMTLPAIEALKQYKPNDDIVESMFEPDKALIREQAYKAEGAPLDQLRLIATFMEGDSI